MRLWLLLLFILGCRKDIPKKRHGVAQRGNLISDSSKVKTFYDKSPKCSQIKFSNCEASVKELELTESGTRIHIGRLIGSGDFGNVYEAKGNSKYMVKFAKQENGGLKDLCEESLILELLDGLHGATPRIHAVKTIPSSDCADQILVMDKVGDSDWTDGMPNFYRRIARLLEVIMSLHDLGFVHADIKSNNIRVNIANPDDVFLIDFGITLPFVNENGSHSTHFSRRIDMEQISNDLLKQQLFPRHSWYKAFRDEMNTLRHDQRPNYEKWIRCLRLLSNRKFRGINYCPA
jgi:predicted Ser/Thr protein kinase